MTTDILLQIILAGLNNTALLTSIYEAATREKRDLTEAEKAIVRDRAFAKVGELEAAVKG